MHSLTELKIVDALLNEQRLIVALNDGRIILYPLNGMTWITDATKEEQEAFSVTDWEVYWDEIDDGITLEHILSPKPRVDFTVEPQPNWKRFYEVLGNHTKSTDKIEFAYSC